MGSHHNNWRCHFLITGFIAWFTNQTPQRQEHDNERALRQERDLEQEPANAQPQHVEQEPSRLKEEGLYLNWLEQRREERMALEKERSRIQDLSPKAVSQLVADLTSFRCGVEYLLVMAEHQLPKGSPRFFWDTISKLDGILGYGIPDKVCALKKHAWAGSALERAVRLEQKAQRFTERLQSLVNRGKGLEAFAQEHALRCGYEEREMQDFKMQLIRPQRASLRCSNDSDDVGGDGDGGLTRDGAWPKRW